MNAVVKTDKYFKIKYKWRNCLIIALISLLIYFVLGLFKSSISLIDNKGLVLFFLLFRIASYSTFSINLIVSLVEIYKNRFMNFKVVLNNIYLKVGIPIFIVLAFGVILTNGYNSTIYQNNNYKTFETSLFNDARVSTELMFSSYDLKSIAGDAKITPAIETLESNSKKIINKQNYQITIISDDKIVSCPVSEKDVEKIQELVRVGVLKVNVVYDNKTKLITSIE